MATNSQEAQFDSRRFIRLLKEMDNLVSDHLMNDLNMNSFKFGVKFGVLYNRAKETLQYDINKGERLSLTVRIPLMGVGQKMYQWRLLIEDACLNQFDDSNISLPKASNLLAEIINGE